MVCQTRTGTGLCLILLLALRAGQGLGGSGLAGLVDKMTAFSGEGGPQQGGDRGHRVGMEGPGPGSFSASFGREMGTSLPRVPPR